MARWARWALLMSGRRSTRSLGEELSLSVKADVRMSPEGLAEFSSQVKTDEEHRRTDEGVVSGFEGWAPNSGPPAPGKLLRPRSEWVRGQPRTVTAGGGHV